MQIWRVCANFAQGRGRYDLLVDGDMKKESLKILDFGALKAVEIPEVGKVNVFIGASGCGKSTIMKVLAMCRWIYKMHCVRSYLKLSGVAASPFSFSSEAILKKNGLDAFVREGSLFDTKISLIEYSYGSFTLRMEGDKFVFPTRPIPDDELALEKVAYISDKRGLLPDLIAGNVALRHGMFYLDETFRNFQLALGNISASSMSYLGINVDVKKTASGKRIFVSPIKPLGSDYEIPLASSSSGIQNSVGLHFILEYFARHYDLVQTMNSTIVRYLADTDRLSDFKAAYNVGDFPYKRISLHIEEPELSLFPENQKGLIDHMLFLMNSSRNAEINLSFATHSPYILTAINLRMLAARAREIDAEATKSILGIVNPLPVKDVTAWEVRDGVVKSLIDNDTLLIDGTWLDSVSDTFDDQISKLNEIIYG